MLFCWRYSNKEGFAADIRLIFDNCKLYNEDDSEVHLYNNNMVIVMVLVANFLTESDDM